MVLHVFNLVLRLELLKILDVFFPEDVKYVSWEVSYLESREKSLNQCDLKTIAAKLLFTITYFRKVSFFVVIFWL